MIRNINYIHLTTFVKRSNCEESSADCYGSHVGIVLTSASRTGSPHAWQQAIAHLPRVLHVPGEFRMQRVVFQRRADDEQHTG
jgi:hypothetical protein